MPFTYTVAEKDKIVFIREGIGCIRAFIFILGGAFTIAGTGMLFIKDAETPLAIMRLVFLGAGLGVLYLGMILPQMQQKNIPDKLIFDNENGRVEIHQQKSDIKTGYIYYDEIENLVIKEKRHESTSDSRKSYYTWNIYLLKKDGGEWELLKRASQSAAQEELTKLRSLLTLDATPGRIPVNIAQSKKYNIYKGSERTELRWRNKPGSGPIGLIFFFLFFLAAGYAILDHVFSTFHNIPWFVYVISGFFGAMFILMIGINIRKIRKNASTEYAVAVNGSALEYIERDLHGREKKNTKFPLSDLHALSFSFDTDNSFRKIYIYTHEQFQRKKDLPASPGIFSFKDFYSFYQNLPALELQDLTAVEALQVENYLQQLIAEKGTAVK